MRTFSVALATALLLWSGDLVNAQSQKKVVLPGAVTRDTAVSADTTHTKLLFKNASVRNASASLGSPAGQKSAGHSKRESDSLQQIILLRKKF